MALRLRAGADLHQAAAVPFEVEPPADPTTRRYLERAGVGPLFGEAGAGERTDVLFPVTRIRRGEEVNRLGEQLEEAIAERLPRGFAGGAPDLKRAFSELCSNACTHGVSEHGTYLILQRLLDKHLVLVVGDLGVGIPDHLGTALPDLVGFKESQRIARALRPGISSRNGDGGDGLTEIVAAIRKAQAARSELRIWSGSGRVRSRSHGTNDWMVGRHTMGTWAEFVLSSSG